MQHLDLRGSHGWQRQECRTPVTHTLGFAATTAVHLSTAPTALGPEAHTVTDRPQTLQVSNAWRCSGCKGRHPQPHLPHLTACTLCVLQDGNTAHFRANDILIGQPLHKPSMHGVAQAERDATTCSKLLRDVISVQQTSPSDRYQTMTHATAQTPPCVSRRTPHACMLSVPGQLCKRMDLYGSRIPKERENKCITARTLKQGWTRRPLPKLSGDVSGLFKQLCT